MAKIEYERRVIDPRGPAQIAAQQRAQAQALSESKRVTASYKAGQISEGAWKTRMGQLAVASGDPKILSAIAGGGGPSVREAGRQVVLQENIRSLPADIRQEIYAGRGDYLIIPSLNEPDLRAWAEKSGYRPKQIVRLQQKIQQESVERRRKIYLERQKAEREAKVEPEPSLRLPSQTAESLQPPIMRQDIHITPTGEFVLFERKPKAVIGLEKVYEKPAPELFEFLRPKRTEREIAYEAREVGFRPVVEFGMGLAYGAVTFPEAIVRLPETVYKIVTDPGAVVKGITEKFARYPTFGIGEVTAQILIGRGIGKITGIGLAKYRARGITAATEVGQYTFEPAKGLGKFGIDIVIKKAGKVIETARAQVGFKVGKKLFDPSVYAAEVVAEKAGLSYILGKGYVISKVTTPSGLATTIAKATGIMYKYPGFKPTLATLGISETLAAPTGLLRTVGLGVSKAGLVKAGQKFYSVLFKKDIPSYKITRIIPKAPKVVTKPYVPAIVGAEVKTIAVLIGKAAVKPGPAITRAGVLTGAVTAFVGMEEAERAVTSIPGRLDDVMDISPWARRKKLDIEEEVYISPRAREVVGIQGLDTRQRAATMQQFGMGTGQAQRTLLDLGVSRAIRPKERLDIGLRQPPAQIQVPVQIQIPGLRQPPGLKLKPPALKLVPILKQPPGLKQPPAMAVPPIVLIKPPTFPFLIPEVKKKVPRKRKPRVKPRYKYRAIKHPFPSLKKLMRI